MTNFRERLDELNEQVAKFDDAQVQVEESEKALTSSKEERDRALAAVHSLIRGLNDMLPSMPDEAQSHPDPEPLKSWSGSNY